MVDRADEPRLTTPIVPGPGDELTTHRSPGNTQSARVWPLWLLVCLLLVGLTTLAWLYWTDRQSWQTTQRELEGQVSNMHARLDSLDDGRGMSPDQLSNELGALGEEQQSLSRQLDELRSTVEGLEENTADSSRIDDLAQRLDGLETQGDTLAATLDATRRSLTALEKQGNEARQGLSERVSRLASDQQQATQRREALAGRTDELTQTQRGMQQQLEALGEVETRIATLGERVDSLNQTSQSRQDEREQLQARIDEIRTAITELRQNQLAINASLESLSAGN
ncbi:hypothetical protein [Modicisalibacter radicis]|uniref:hypothetical protein n=1 Tax=Halomonas sp. EAR18 TaxID=2518972 RepID=UPI00109C885F|nr:hypothetical protein [Halomonas sp. EAR18]